MRSLLRMFCFVKPYRWQVLGAMILLLGMVAADLLIPRLTQTLIDEGVARQDMPVILRTALWMLGAAALSALFAVGNTILAVRVGQGLGTDIRSALVRKVQTFSFGNLDRLQTGQLLVRATSDINQVQMIYQMALRILTRAPLWMVGSIALLFATSVQLALMMLALMVVILGLIVLFMGRVRPMFLLTQSKLDRLNQVMQENLAGVRVVKAFVRSAHESARFGRANDELTGQTMRVMQLSATLIPTMQLFVSLGMVAVIWFGGHMAIDGRFAAGRILSAGKLIASVNYMSRSLFPLPMLGGMIGPLSAADASAARILEVLDSEPEVANVDTKILTQRRRDAEERRGFQQVQANAFAGTCTSRNTNHE